jgi:hypothetical protein
MTDRELMQQALDALKVMRPACFAETTLKAADTAITALRDKLAQPEQEPVAWMVYTQDGQSVYVTDNPIDIQEGQRDLPIYSTPPPCPTCEALARTVMLDQTSHDTQRQWVGLTDEEKQTAIWTDGTFGAGALWADAKLKEKNT